MKLLPAMLFMHEFCDPTRVHPRVDTGLVRFTHRPNGVVEAVASDSRIVCYLEWLSGETFESGRGPYSLFVPCTILRLCCRLFDGDSRVFFDHEIDLRSEVVTFNRRKRRADQATRIDDTISLAFAATEPAAQPFDAFEAKQPTVPTFLSRERGHCQPADEKLARILRFQHAFLDPTMPFGPAHGEDNLLSWSHHPELEQIRLGYKGPSVACRIYLSTLVESRPETFDWSRFRETCSVDTGLAPHQDQPTPVHAPEAAEQAEAGGRGDPAGVLAPAAGAEGRGQATA